MVVKSFIPPACQYEVEGDHIKTDKTLAHKVTGTAMGGIMDISHWSSPFQKACNLLGLANEDISDKPAVIAGKILESVIIEYMDMTREDLGLFIPAEDMYALREGDHENWASDFEDDYFAGHVDGIVMADDGNNYILEVKTSSNLEDWANGVPEYYFWQVALYNHFITKQDKAYVALGIMNEASLKDPHSWVPNEKNCILYTVKIDQEAVSAKLEEIRAWYDKYIRNGLTPDYNPANKGDVLMWEHLFGLTDDDKTVSALIEEDMDLRTKILMHEAEAKSLYDRKAALDAKLKDYLMGHPEYKGHLVSSSGKYKAVLSESVRTSFDEERMRADGIDPAKYKVEKVSKSFTIKNN